jgi:hypothetical protein
MKMKHTNKIDWKNTEEKKREKEDEMLTKK